MSSRRRKVSPRHTALLLGSVTACSSAVPSPATAPSPVTQAASAVPSASKADSAPSVFTKADIDFMSGMIGHHAQAVQMARWAPGHGASPTLRALCERIVVGQSDEIALMQRWLRERGQPVPEADPRGHFMPGMDHPMLMPGMLTPEQMDTLDRARGLEFDRLFLRYMIQHHEGAITMVEGLFGSWGAGRDEVVFRFASDVYADQTTEIDRMSKMLAALTPDPTRP